MNKNDKKIMELQAQVEQKEKELKQDSVQPFVTNLKQDILPQLPNNMNVMGTSQLVHLVAYIENIFTVTEKENLDWHDLVTGDLYSWAGIKADAKILIAKKKRRVKEESLKALKSKLAGMLSEQARTVQEIDNIEDMLKGM